MSSPSPTAENPVPLEWYCHACSRTTRSPVRTPDLQCPTCGSDFLEELSSADDPRRIEDLPEGLPPSPGPADNPFHNILASLLGAGATAAGPAPPSPSPGSQQDQPQQQQHQHQQQDPQAGQQQQQQQPAFSFSFTTSGVDATGRRFTRFHGSPGDDPLRQQTEQNQDQDQNQDQNRPSQEGPAGRNLTMNDLLTQAFQGNPNPPQAPTDRSQGDTEAQQQNRPRHNFRVVPMSMAGLLGSMLGGGGPTAVLRGPAGPDGQGADFQFTFNSTFGPLQGADGAPAMRWGDALNDRGLDDFITALMNQAASNAEGPRRAPDELIHSLPRKNLTQEDLASFRNAECAVCKEDFNVDDDAIFLPCSHVFHADCIVPWLERSGTCAVCRHELVEQPHPHAPRPAPPAQSQQGQDQQAQQQPSEGVEDDQSNDPASRTGGQDHPRDTPAPQDDAGHRPHIVLGVENLGDLHSGQGIGALLSRMFGIATDQFQNQGPPQQQPQQTAQESQESSNFFSGAGGDHRTEESDDQSSQTVHGRDRHDTPEQEPLD